MTPLYRPLLVAAALWLALANAAAQTPPSIAKPPAKPAGKTLSGKAPGGGKLMTREELRSCLKRLDEVNKSGKELEALRPQLDRDRDELKAAGETLKAERGDIDRQLAAVREWEGRVGAHSAEIEGFNARSNAVQEAPRHLRDKMGEDLKAERERLQKSREALAVDEAKLVPAYQANVKAHNERATARDARVVDWNARNAAAVEASTRQQEVRALWLNECANRPYLEDDEKAIQAGK